MLAERLKRAAPKRAEECVSSRSAMAAVVRWKSLSPMPPGFYTRDGG
jgi:hypothetical protein